jgi:RNA polymerase sigma-70 factor (ECF subfamily)
MSGQSATTVRDGASDAELVRSALGGDAVSLSSLLVRYRAELYARALSYLGRPEDAADAVQETFLLSITHLADVRDPQTIRGWLHAVLRSVCLRELRRPARRLTVAHADIDRDISAGRDAAEDLALRDWVWAALDDLPEHLQLVTLLRFFGPCHSYAEIAACCGLRVGTVRSRLHRAKSELGARLLAESGTAPHGDGGWSLRVRASYFALNDQDPDPYLAMFADDAEIAASGLVVRGRSEIREMCEQDLNDGVGTRLVEVISSAGITVLECELINPEADPGHCPSGVTHVLLHGGEDRVHRSLGYFHRRPEMTSESDQP